MEYGRWWGADGREYVTVVLTVPQAEAINDMVLWLIGHGDTALRAFGDGRRLKALGSGAGTIAGSLEVQYPPRGPSPS